MEAHQRRVVEEKAALNDKLDKLKTFLLRDDFKDLDASEQERLTRQAEVMEAYSAILSERIAAFK